MTGNQRETNRRLPILKRSEKNGNKAITCRYFGIGKSTFYEWRTLFRKGGVGGIMMDNGKARFSATVRVFWLCSLCLYMAGCAGTYERISLPAATTDVDQTNADPARLKIGERIRISDDHGRKVEGVYGGVSDTKLVLVNAEMVSTPEDKYSEFGKLKTVHYDQTSEFTLADIAVLEKYEAEPEKIVLAVGLAFAVYLAIDSFIDHWNENFWKD